MSESCDPRPAEPGRRSSISGPSAGPGSITWSRGCGRTVQRVPVHGREHVLAAGLRQPVRPVQQLVRRHRGVARATALSSALFGLWHILPSLGLEKVNPALGSVVGNGLSGPILAVVVAVVFTTVSGVIFCELRRHSGSLLAAVGLHWATNGLGVVIAAGLWAGGVTVARPPSGRWPGRSALPGLARTG
jgi:hypothetical protein